MRLSLAFPILLIALPLSPAGAEPRPLPQCQRLLAMKDEVQKQSQALLAAGRKRVPPDELCNLFNEFLAAESKLVRGLEAQRAACGLTRPFIEQVKTVHGKVTQLGKRVCDVAEHGPPRQECRDTLWERLSCPLPVND
jgi:hypothetical protein